jgi:uncharacterized protein YlxW (UPF0749 family)
LLKHFFFLLCFHPYLLPSTIEFSLILFVALTLTEKEEALEREKKARAAEQEAKQQLEKKAEELEELQSRIAELEAALEAEKEQKVCGFCLCC